MMVLIYISFTRLISCLTTTNKMSLFMETEIEDCVRNSRRWLEIDQKCACQFYSWNTLGTFRSLIMNFEWIICFLYSANFGNLKGKSNIYVLTYINLWENQQLTSAYCKRKPNCNTTWQEIQKFTCLYVFVVKENVKKKAWFVEMRCFP